MNGIPEQIGKTWLDDRTASFVDRANLFGVDIDAHHFVAVAGQRRCRNASNVSEAED
jgi:hypothetical protein